MHHPLRNDPHDKPERAFLEGAEEKAPQKPSHSTQSGAALIGLIAALILFGSLGAALVPLVATSTLTDVTASHAMRAYYNAESGYRYAASKFLHNDINGPEDRDTVLESGDDGIHDNTFTFSENGSFHTKVKAYYYAYDDMDGVDLKAIPYGEAPEGGSGPGKLAVFDTDHMEFYDYGGYNYSQEDNEIRFTIVGSDVPDGGTRVFPVVVPDAGSYSTPGSSVTIQGNGNGLFPESHGAFRVYRDTGGLENADIYTYKKLTDGGVLTGVRKLSDPTGNLDLNLEATDYLVLQRFIELTSIGAYGEATRTLTYYVVAEAVPGGGTGGGLPEALVDMEDMLGGDRKGTAIGDWELANVGDGEALYAVKMTDGKRSEAFIPRPMSDSASSNFVLAWSSNGNYLSYDAQVKVATQFGDDFDDGNKPEYYCGGLMFRLRGKNFNSGQVDGYGLSFMRGSSVEDTGGIPGSATPVDDQAMVLLWSRGGRSSSGDVWLAYQRLSADDRVIRDEIWRSKTDYRLGEIVQYPDDGGERYQCQGAVIKTGKKERRLGECQGAPDEKDSGWEICKEAGRCVGVHLKDWSAIAVQVTEAASIKLASSETSIKAGFILTGTGGGKAKVVDRLLHDGNVVLLLNDVDESFTPPPIVDGHTLDTGWGDGGALRPRDNFVRAYYGVYARDTYEWPLTENFEPVVWGDALNTAEDDTLARLTEIEGSETTVIRTNLWVSDATDYATSDSGAVPEELGLHQLGGTEYNNKDRYLYFDDFAYRLEASLDDPNGVGFLAAVVEQ